MIVLAEIFRAVVLAAAAVVVWAVANPAAGVPLGLLGWAAYAHFNPYRTCRWCRPGGLIGGSYLVRRAGYRPKPGHRGRCCRCWRCEGSQLTRRLGAYHAHKVKLSLIQAWNEREWWR